MGEIGGFTAANIAADLDKHEEAFAEKHKGAQDYSKLEADIEAKKEQAAKGGLQEALDGLLQLEKQQRLAESVTGTRLCCGAVLDVLFKAQQWQLLNEHILLLAKRRSQLKQAVQAFVKQAMGYVDQTPDTATRVELIKTLQTVTEGKIYVEIERARLTKRLAAIKEQEGSVAEAADILQEVAVETFGAMAKTEKIAYILEQVRLCLDRQDFVRAQILAKKVSPRAFAVQPSKKGQEAGEVGIEGTTIEYPDKAYLDITRCYRAILDTEAVAADPAQWQPVLKKICWYVALAATSSDQVTLLNLTASDKRLGELPAYKELLQTLITQEVIWWSTFSTQYADEVAEHPDIFSGEAGAPQRDALRLRVTEHNILVVAKYYARITLPRLATLLALPVAEAEKHLSDMVVAGALTARIDRPAGIVRFAARRAPAAALNSWASNISRLLQIVDRACQNIQKESMVHKVAIEATT